MRPLKLARVNHTWLPLDWDAWLSPSAGRMEPASTVAFGFVVDGGQSANPEKKRTKYRQIDRRLKKPIVH